MNHKSIAKISAAIEFIETHLTEKLELERIADEIHYSKYYLHRVFTNTVRLTIHDYVQRRQLTEAAKLLVFSTWRENTKCFTAKRQTNGQFILQRYKRSKTK